MNETTTEQLHLSVRRFNGAWRVVATDGDAEHTHGQAFFEREDAWKLLAEIRRGLAGGQDLDLRFWDSVAR